MENNNYYHFEDQFDETTQPSVEEPGRDTIDEVWSFDYEFYPDGAF
jgi:hypothetical protein